MILIYEIFSSVVEFIMWFVDVIIALAGKGMEMFKKIFDILQSAGDWFSNIFDTTLLSKPGFFDNIIQPRPISPDPGFVDPGHMIPHLPGYFNPVLPDNFIPF